MNWVFISDLHVGKSGERDSRIKEYLKNIEEKYRDYGLIHGGDGSNDGEAKQIRLLKALLRPWQESGRLIHVPGNHDRGWEGFEADEKCVKFWDRTFGSSWNKCRIEVHEVPPHRFIAIDSTYHHRLVFASSGEITDAGLIELNEQIRLGDIVLLHHNPFDRDPTMLLEDSADFCRIVENRASVVLYGHSGKYGVNVHRFGTKYWCCGDESPIVGSCVLLEEGKEPRVAQVL